MATFVFDKNFKYFTYNFSDVKFVQSNNDNTFVLLLRNDSEIGVKINIEYTVGAGSKVDDWIIDVFEDLKDAINSDSVITEEWIAQKAKSLIGETVIIDAWRERIGYSDFYMALSDLLALCGHPLVSISTDGVKIKDADEDFIKAVNTIIRSYQDMFIL